MRRFEIFYNFGEILNMTKVGEKLYISQSAVSQAIKELENEFNVKLFDKIGKKLFLTFEGKILFNYSKKIISLYYECKGILNKSKKIIIGASTTIGIYVLPELIKDFLSNYGNDFEISIKIENTENIINYILNNQIDFAFIEGIVDNKEIVNKNFCKDELIFITNSKDGKIINGDELYKEKMIIREKGSGTREIFEEVMNRKKINFNIAFELGNTEAIKKVVEAGMGISCLSKLAVEEEIKTGKISELKIRDIQIERFFKLVYHKDKYINESMKKFIEFSTI